MLSKAAWFRPYDTVIKVPYTPESELATMVREVTREEGERLGIKVKVQEGGGIPLRRNIVNTGLSRGTECPQGDCPLCLTGEGRGGLHHHRSGAVYSGECRLCGDTVTARYWGESGDSAYCRTKIHAQSILNRDEQNAFAKHLKIYHPSDEGNINAFKFLLKGTFRQKTI